jgi:hypothetical protein
MSKEEGKDFVQTLPQKVPKLDPSLAPTRTVLAYYDAINARDTEAATALMSRTVRYEDFSLYGDAQEGSVNIQAVFAKWCDLPTDVKFILDDYTVSATTLVPYAVKLHGSRWLPTT